MIFIGVSHTLGLIRFEAATSVNPRRQLDWTITIPAGEEQELTYRYELLVDR